MITSKPSTRARTTIPQAVRSALHLSEGDEIGYAIEGSRVTTFKSAKTETTKHPFGTFGEWASEADCHVYGGL